MMKLRIRIANRKDYGKILEFSNKAKWKYELKDFYLMEKSGISKTLLLENEVKNEIIGMITIFDYGEIIWIANLFIDEKWRGKGYGSYLIKEVIKLFNNKNTIALFSKKETIDFYIKNGFKIDKKFYLVRFIEDKKNEDIDKKGWSEIIPIMDYIAFGYKRESLLKLLVENGYVIYENNGFAIIRPEDKMIGPVICENDNLLYLAMRSLGYGTMAIVKKIYENMEIIYEIIRMYTGKKPIDNRIAIAFTGLEYG